MNCLDFRRLCLVEPKARDARIYLHLYHCPACRAYRKKILAAEQQMTSAMQVPVPEGLDRKIVFDHAMQSDNARRRGWSSWRAVAAGIVLGIGLSIGLVVLNAKPDLVAPLAMHMADDPLHMTPPQVDASQRLDQVMRHLGGHWSGQKPAITHATLCLVKKQAAAHLVVAGKQGPVTVFLIPKLNARERNDLPVDGQYVDVSHIQSGSIALFGYEGEDLDAVRQQFMSAVQWSGDLAKRASKLRLAGF